MRPDNNKQKQNKTKQQLYKLFNKKPIIKQKNKNC